MVALLLSPVAIFLELKVKVRSRPYYKRSSFEIDKSYLKRYVDALLNQFLLRNLMVFCF